MILENFFIKLDFFSNGVNDDICSTIRIVTLHWTFFVQNSLKKLKTRCKISGKHKSEAFPKVFQELQGGKHLGGSRTYCLN